MKYCRTATWSLEAGEKKRPHGDSTVYETCGGFWHSRSLILCVQYPAHRRANNNLQRPCSAHRKVPASGFGRFALNTLWFFAACHILMEHWVRPVQLPPGLGKNSSHGKTKGYKYDYPNLPAAAPVPALCGK